MMKTTEDQNKENAKQEKQLFDDVDEAYFPFVDGRCRFSERSMPFF